MLGEHPLINTCVFAYIHVSQPPYTQGLASLGVKCVRL